MKTKHFSVSGLLSLILIVSSCNKGPKGDGTITYTDIGNSKVTVCQVGNIKKTEIIPLSKLIDDFRIVRFENKDEALFKAWYTTITDNHIGIRQDAGPFKLFDHKGKYLCDIGSVGNGPGEYNSLYDEYIDEKEKEIYLLPFANPGKIQVFDIGGNFKRVIDIKRNLSKPKMQMTEEGTIALIHLAFFKENDNEKPFFAMQTDKEGNIQQECLPAPTQFISFFNKDGQAVGFNMEVFSFRNTPAFEFFNTGLDTLYHYNTKTNTAQPVFTAVFPGTETDSYHLYYELPGYYVIGRYNYKENTSSLIGVDKQEETSRIIRIKNDFVGGLELPAQFTFNRGWYLQMFEPMELAEVIEKRLSQPDCSETDRKLLKELAATLNENDNNILFMGKLKQ